MAFSPENHPNNDFVERNPQLERQLAFRFERAREDENRAWGNLFKGVKNLSASDWGKLVGAGFLIGTAWYLKRGQKVGDWLEGGGWRLLRLFKDAWRGLRKK